MSSKYGTKQHTFAQLSSKQMSKIEYKDIRAFLRYHNFGVGVFFRFTLYTQASNNMYMTTCTCYSVDTSTVIS